MKTIEERANDAYHFVESERQTAIGRENTGGWYFPNVYRNGYIKGATEQKAIDEEVMHAIVEEQVLKAINKQKAIDDAERDTAVYNLLQLKLDAEKKLWLNKACNFLNNYDAGDFSCYDEFEAIFRKAMEEQQ